LKISDKILAFFDGHKRDLPWRNNPTPYKTLVSEIMLQQTRVDTVIPYFNRFMKELPTISSLAKADDELLYKLWQGLGYYNRAKNLKKAAIIIMEKHGGIIPNTISELESLPGIGPYTAGAIGAIAFQINTVAIDGNVLRVFSRYFGITDDIRLESTKNVIKSRLEGIYPANRLNDFTEALMEIGAIVCLPNGKPLCDTCPLSNACFAYSNKMIDVIPLKSKLVHRRKELKTVLFIKKEDRVLILKRPRTGILSNLWELPNIEGHLSKEEVLLWLSQNGLPASRVLSGINFVHIFTHIEWNMKSYVVQIDQIPFHMENDFIEITEIEKKYSVPTAFLPFFNQFK